MWSGVASRTNTQKKCLKLDWTTCLKFDNHSMFNNKHNLQREVGTYMVT